MTIPAAPPSPHAGPRHHQPPPPPLRNNSSSRSPRTPPPHRNSPNPNNRSKNLVANNNTNIHMTMPTRPPFGAPEQPAHSSSRQIIVAAAPSNSQINPQWQIHDQQFSQSQQQQPPHHPAYNRRHHPPPPPPPPHRSSSKSSIHNSAGAEQLNAAAQELQRAFSAGSAPAPTSCRRTGSSGSSPPAGRRRSNSLPGEQQQQQHQYPQQQQQRRDSKGSVGSFQGQGGSGRRNSYNRPATHPQQQQFNESFNDSLNSHTLFSIERRNSSELNSSDRGADQSMEIYPAEGSGGYHNNYSLNNNMNNSNNSSQRGGLVYDPNYDENNHNNKNATIDEEEDDDEYHEHGHQRHDGEDGRSDDGGNEHDVDDEGDESIQDEPKDCISRILGALLCIFPKVEPLPWGTFAILTLWSAIPPACFILFFTQMGFGEQIYYTIATEMGHHAYALALGLAVLLFLLYMLDADEWTSQFGSILLDVSILIIVCGFVLLVLLIADRFPYGMVCLFAVFHPLWLLALKLMFYDAKDTRVFVSWLSGPLFFISIVVGATWVAWVFSDPDNEWNIVARMAAAERTGCVPNYENYPECRKEPGSDETCFHVEKEDGKETIIFPEGCEHSCTNVYNDCLNGFILWVGPVLVSMTTFFLSFFCTFLRTEGAREKDVLNFGAVWIFILFAMWVTTSLAGTASGVTAALAALTLASFVASAMFVAVSFSKEERSQNASAVMVRVREKYGKHLDVARGLFIVTCAPIVLAYLGLSIMNQLVRRSGIFPCSQPPGEEDSMYTTRTRKQVAVMKSWDRAKVYTYAVYWGIAFMILQVIVANLTVVFLSWIIEKTANLGLAAVTAIMCGVGVMMFLLPPVPGVPVYLTIGIVLPAQGHELFGWIGAIMYTTGVGLVLKLFSSALQQKLIGEKLSHYVKVRQFVGINSTLMKAMRLVLGKKGLSVPKVSILIGGPDWPTSVLCGIMRLSLPQIMLGTVPIVFLIFPTVLTGALLYMASLETDTGNPEFPWAGTVSTITASATAIVQFGSMIVAAYYLEQAAGKRAAEIDAIQDDREVKEADDKAAHLKRCYKDVTQWNVIPIGAKLLLQISLACIITSSYMVQLFSNLCFTPHSLTDSIDDNLDGKVSNLFLPLGWVSVGLFCISIILIYLFESWGEQKAYKLANGIVVSASPGESSIQSSSSPGTPHPDHGFPGSGSHAWE